MRRLVWVTIAVAVLMAACSSTRRAAPPVPVTTTTVPLPRGLPVAHVSTTAAQRIEGFGASGAWWPNDLAHFPDSAQRVLAQVLFSRQNIGLSGYRYNIGGGGKGVTTPARAPKEFPDDTAGRTFLRLASDANVEVLTGFVNSAPPQFTTNGKACGGRLEPGRETAYAQYLADIVRSLHDDDHITLRYVSPMNEPDDSFPTCGQEGMQVPVAQRAAVVQALGRALAKTAPYARVIADETAADLLAAQELPQWLARPGTAKYLGALAHHTYDFPNDGIRAGVPRAVSKFGIPTWMTEICCYKGSGAGAAAFGAQYDPSMIQGLWLADQVYADLTVAGDSAWYWWTAVSPELGCSPAKNILCVAHANAAGFNDGLFYYDPDYAKNHDYMVFPTRRLYVLGQFSHYVRPGAIRHDVTGVPNGSRAMAFADGKTWTVVAWNEGTKAATFGLSVPGTTTATGAASTSQLFNMTRAATPPRTSTGAWLVTLAPQTITTYTFG